MGWFNRNKAAPQAAQSAPAQRRRQQRQKGPGIWARGWNAAMDALPRRTARQSATGQGTHQQDSSELEAMDGIERAKLGFARFWLFGSAFLFAIIAGWSVGYFFAGLHDFTTDNQETLMSYAGSWGIEGVIMAALFVVTLNKGRGRRWMPALVFATVLAGVSVLAQFAAYEALRSAGRIQVSDSQIEAIPLLNWLIGSMQGHSFLFLLRGASFHIAEIGACLLMPSKRLTLDEQLIVMMRQAVAQKMQAELRQAARAIVQQSQAPALPAAQPAPAGAAASNGHSTSQVQPFRSQQGQP